MTRGQVVDRGCGNGSNSLVHRDRSYRCCARWWKGANLGELTTTGLPVPPGFVVTADAYLNAVSKSGARDRLALLRSGLNVDDPTSLTETHQAARELILATPIPAETDAIENAYRRLGDNVAVAVRSSGTTEDAGDSSFAGMNASFTNVIGLRNVLARIKDCWASTVASGCWPIGPSNIWARNRRLR